MTWILAGNRPSYVLVCALGAIFWAGFWPHEGNTVALVRWRISIWVCSGDSEETYGRHLMILITGASSLVLVLNKITELVILPAVLAHNVLAY
jgi:hypothetical protein